MGRNPRKPYQGKKTKKAQKPPNPRILIACEDSKKSPAYLRALRDDLRFNSKQIDIDGSCGSSPISVVNYAIRKIQEDRKQNGKDSYECAYCVIDHDNHETLAEAINKASSHQKIKINLSVPCFEFWILLHFQDTDHPFKNGDAVYSAIKKHVPSYDKKSTDYTFLYEQHLREKTEHAIRCSKKIWNECQLRCDKHSNPSTQMHELVEFLKEKSSKQ
jgi:hypothetical protein